MTPTPYGCVGKPLQFVVDAGNSGEGNLEIAVNAKGLNVMTQVQPMGGAKFGVAFTPNEVCEVRRAEWSLATKLSFSPIY